MLCDPDRAQLARFTVDRLHVANSQVWGLALGPAVGCISHAIGCGGETETWTSKLLAFSVVRLIDRRIASKEAFGRIRYIT